MFEVDDLGRYLDILRKLGSGSDVEPFEAKIHIHEQPYWFEIIPSHLANFNGQVAIQIVARDITAGKVTEQALKEIE